MASVNKVILVGNLTRDPQFGYIPGSQTPVADFGLAMNRRFKKANGEDGEEVVFVDVTAYGKQAEVINQYCTKGKALYVEGRLKLETWEDRNGGGKRSKLKVIVETFQFLGGGGQGQGQANGVSRDRGGDQRDPRANHGQEDQRPRDDRYTRNLSDPPARRPERDPDSTIPDHLRDGDDDGEFKDDDIPF